VHIYQYEKIQEKIEQKTRKSKKTKMVISGKSVFSLNKIINKKAGKLNK
jgi:hypothetical protein